MRCRICGEDASITDTAGLCFRCYVDTLGFADTSSCEIPIFSANTTLRYDSEWQFVRREKQIIKYLGFMCYPVGYLTSSGYIVNRGEKTVGEIETRHEPSCNTLKLKCTDIEDRVLYFEDGCAEDLDTHIRRALTALLHTSKHELCKEDFEYVREIMLT